MKKITVLIMILIIALPLIFGCQSPQEKEAKQAKIEVGVAQIKKEYLESYYRREAVLLALKYKVEEDKVFNLLVEDNPILDGTQDFQDIMDMVHSKNLRRRIEHYSEEYNIPTDIIASILIDCQMMQDIQAGRE